MYYSMKEIIAQVTLLSNTHKSHHKKKHYHTKNSDGYYAYTKFSIEMQRPGVCSHVLFNLRIP